MAACVSQPMIIRHESPSRGAVREVLRLWWRRYLERTELAVWTERDLNDVGLSRGDVVHEIEKPFWRG
jgi:uncharacterized protein YjiS (DUF1127 family)